MIKGKRLTDCCIGAGFVQIDSGVYLEEKMIVIRFGKWRSKHGRLFSVERVFINGITWTPICVKRFRYMG